MKIPKPKKISTAKKKKQLDAIFSKYIRAKYAKNGMVACYTCGAVKPISEMQNGHFISRSYLATRYLEENCRPQDWGCNAKHLGNGRPVEFARKLEEETPGIVNKLYLKAQEITKYYPYDEKIKEFTEKYREISGD